MEQQLKLLYPAVDEEIIALVVSTAESFVLDYCNLVEIPSGLQSVLLEMCKEDINRIGAEGFTAESAGGASISYGVDYTDQVYKRLKKHKRIKML